MWRKCIAKQGNLQRNKRFAQGNPYQDFLYVSTGKIVLQSLVLISGGQGADLEKQIKITKGEQ